MARNDLPNIPSAQIVNNEEPRIDDDNYMPNILSARLVDPNSPAAQSDQQLLRNITVPTNNFIDNPVQNNIFADILDQQGQETIVPDISATRSLPQNIVDAALRLPFPTLQAENVSRHLLGPDSPVTSGIESFNSELPFGFGEEFNAAIDTLSDILTGNIREIEDQNFVENIIDQFYQNADLRRAVLERAKEKNPKSHLAGKFSAMVPRLALFRGKGLVGKAATMGFLEGLGESDKKIWDPEIFKDGLTVGAISGLLTSAGVGLQKLSKVFLPKTLNDVAGYARISGGGDPGRARQLIVKPNQLPPEIEGFKLAKEAGYLKIVNNRVVQPGLNAKVIPSVKEIVKNPVEAFQRNWPYIKEQAKNLGRFKTSDIDYNVLQTQMRRTLTNLREAKLQLLSQTLKNQTYSIDDVFAGKISNKTQKVLNDLADVQDDFQRFGLSASDDEARAFRSLSKIMQRQNLSAQELERLSKDIGIITRKSINKQLPDGPMKSLIDNKFEIDDFLQNKLNAARAGAGEKYAQINDRAHKFASFSDDVDRGASLSLKDLGASEQFEMGGLSRILKSPGSDVGVADSITPGKLLFGGANLIERGLGLGSLAAGKTLSNPTINTFIASTLFNSFEDGKIVNSKDRALARHYIELNPKLTELQKTKQIHQLNKMGNFDVENIPVEVQEAIKTKHGLQE